MADNLQETIGVVLLNLGGPERLADVEPFLFNLFSDRQIIRLGPKFLQKPLARFISWRRAPKSCESYRLIGGGSPLNRITALQAAALEKTLQSEGAFRVVMAMRYWQPFARQTLEKLAQEGIRKIVALTLYPHYSVATTGSSIDDLRLVAAEFDPPFDIVDIPAWPTQVSYVKELAATILEGKQRMGDEPFQLVYSAHSLPVKFIDEGDPYLEHLQQTIQAVEAHTGLAGKLCFQSRSGPVRWLSPSTPEMLTQLAGDGCRATLMVPISFISDHVETLYEIDIQYRQLAQDLGMRLERTESLNERPGFIVALQELVVQVCREHGLLDERVKITGE